jgi:5-methylcytosine-specific restriction endonuclease McrA
MSNYKDKEKRKATQRAYYHAHKEKMLAAKKAQYARNCEVLKARVKAYQVAHREHVRETVNKYHAANKDRLKIYAKVRYAARPVGYRREESLAVRHAWLADPANRAKSNAATERWRVRHPEKRKDKWHRRRAREIGTQVEKVDLKQILRDANGLCGICKQPLDLFGIHFDHIIPLSRGGTHTTGNIQATHARCNQLKGAKLPEEMVS